MNLRGALLTLSIFPIAGAISATAASQSLPLSSESTAKLPHAISLGQVPSYVRPTHRQKVGSYLLNTFGPLPISESVASAGIDQFDNSPPEWNQGAAGFGKRLGSDFGIAAIGTTTRYALSEAFREDSLYYRCECTGTFPRAGHAAISALTARRGRDGHRTFALSALLAPYAGSSAAVYGWYPSRYGAKDAFRLGNYSLLTTVLGNIALEFLHDGPHFLRHRNHLEDNYKLPDRGPVQ